MEKRSPRGALWHKWDLHVHTPDSIVHNYPGTNDEAWDAFIDDLESLPPEFKVIGINDYLFLDGYRRVLRYKEQGRIRNIALLLPVVELRLNVFGGSRSKLSKVNYHVIFSDELHPDIIEGHFIRALTARFDLLPRYAGGPVAKSWTGILSKESLESLGNAIINAAPVEERAKYGTPLIEGFNNLTLSLETVQELLKSSFLIDHHLTAVGKTEWADIRWQDGAIADKRNVVCGVDCVFTAADTIASFENGRRALAGAEVNSRLLDCSDAHNLSGSNDKDRIGNCATWMKADLTFGGLRHALHEYDYRVFVGDEPPQLRRIREHPSRVADRIKVRKVPASSLKDPWFDNTDVPLNPGLIVIIGNKGSGKSALAEIIALAGGSPQSEYLSFLTASRFRDPRKDLSSHFEAEVQWRDESPSTPISLTDNPGESIEVRVRHLPQRYLENLCNETPRGEKTQFDRELERIIFSHLPVEQKLGASSLEAVVSLIVEAVRTTLEARRKDLSRLNAEIWSIDRDQTSDARAVVVNKYKARRREWYELKRSNIPPVQEPIDSDPRRSRVRSRIRELSSARSHLVGLQEERENELAAVNRDVAALDGLRSRIVELQSEVSHVQAQLNEILARLGMSDSPVNLAYDANVLIEAARVLADRKAALGAQISEDAPRSIASAIIDLDQTLSALRKELTAPQEAYENYLSEVERRGQDLDRLVGAVSRDSSSLLGLRSELERIRRLPKVRQELHVQRVALVREIHKLLREESARHAELYAPLQQAMDKQNVPEDYRLTVATALVEDGLSAQLLDTLINRQVTGSFSGVVESQRELDRLIAATDFDDADSVVALIEAIEQRLHRDYRYADKPAVNLPSQFRKGVTPNQVYDKIFGLDYLSPRFGLKFGDKPIYQLSPGEKGTLLLIFFLMADLESMPLIVDQPEDNLDNHTVYRALVHAFRAAKVRRQVIIVTHNPNLAVVCDADQVIVARMDKGAVNRVEYLAGALENPDVLRRVIDILEGTRPAFENRSTKYLMHRFGYVASAEPPAAGA